MSRNLLLGRITTLNLAKSRLQSLKDLKIKIKTQESDSSKVDESFDLIQSEYRKAISGSQFIEDSILREREFGKENLDVFKKIRGKLSKKLAEIFTKEIKLIPIPETSANKKFPFNFFQKGLKPFLSSKKRINVVGLRGIIGDLGRFQKGLTLEGCSEILERAFTYKNPSLVIIKINSPGGSPVQSELIHNRIKDLAKRNKTKVITIAEDVAASGGYMLMCAGDILLANKSSIVGSIGVISASFGFKKLIDKVGIKRRVFTKGDRKSFLDPFEEVSKKDINKLIRVQDSIFENFKDLVLKNRKKKIKPSQVFNGEFWTGEQAKSIGLVDSNEDLNSYIEKNYGKNIRIRHIEGKKSFIKNLLGSKASSVDLIDQLVQAMRENSLWGRYGL